MRTPTPPRVSSRDQKLTQLASMQEGDQRQQQLDQQAAAQSATQGQAAQNGLLQMLTGLYGLQNEQELNPLKQSLIQAQTSGQNIENQYKPGLYQAQTAAEQNRGDLYGREKTNDPNVDQLIRGHQGGIFSDDEVKNYQSPAEIYSVRTSQKAAKNQANWSTTEQGVRTGSVQPNDPSLLAAWGPENVDYLAGLPKPTAPPKAKGNPVIDAVINTSPVGMLNQYNKWIMDLLKTKPGTTIPEPAPQPRSMPEMYLPQRGRQIIAGIQG